MAELQDAIVKWSNQNMELASELETERLRVSHLRAQVTADTAQRPPPSPAVPPEATPTPGGRVRSEESMVDVGVGCEEEEAESLADVSAALVEEKQQEINVSSIVGRG